jgi:2-oxo-4-hydroxy-4-carboxy-5-ureidoimidazoline decarboxylase
VSLPEFNAAPADVASAMLTACCDVPSWVDAVREGRPYADVQAALDVADKSARSFTPDDVDRALAAHPRIGERAAGSGTEAAWSRQEQSGVSRDSQTQDALLDANRAYEERFNRVFLICASGLSGDQVLTALRARLGNDDATETAVVADELRKIALLRLERLLDS